MHEFAALVKWYWQGNTEVHREKPAQLPRCPPQILRGLVCKWTLASAMRDRRVVILLAAHYGLDVPGIESLWGQGFQHPSRPALGFTQHPVQWAPGLFLGDKVGGAWGWPPPSSFPFWAFMGCSRENCISYGGREFYKRSWNFMQPCNRSITLGTAKYRSVVT